MQTPIEQKDKDFVSTLIKLMLVMGAVAMAYVILKSCSTPKTGMDQFAKASLSKLVVLNDAPPAPALTITGPDGLPTSVRASIDGVTLVNVWATWCAPCVAELPSLDALANKYDITVIAISVDRTAKEAAEFLALNGVNNLPLYHDNTFAIASAEGLNARGIPVSVFYTGSGQEIARVLGEADWNSPESDALMAHLLKL